MRGGEGSGSRAAPLANEARERREPRGRRQLGLLLPSPAMRAEPTLEARLRLLLSIREENPRGQGAEEAQEELEPSNFQNFPPKHNALISRLRPAQEPSPHPHPALGVPDTVPPRRVRRPEKKLPSPGRSTQHPAFGPTLPSARCPPSPPGPVASRSCAFLPHPRGPGSPPRPSSPCTRSPG